mgnify:CR=1 FL=1
MPRTTPSRVSSTEELAGHFQAMQGRYGRATGIWDCPETEAALNYGKQLYETFVPGTLSWLDPNNNKAFLDGQVSVTNNGISIYYAAKNSQDPKVKERMAEQLGIAPSGLSFHLKELAHAGLVSAQLGALAAAAGWSGCIVGGFDDLYFRKRLSQHSSALVPVSIRPAGAESELVEPGNRTHRLDQALENEGLASRLILQDGIHDHFRSRLVDRVRGRDGSYYDNDPSVLIQRIDRSTP